MKDLKIAAKHLANKFNLRKSKSEVYRRHIGLKENYDVNPEKATIVDYAEVIGKDFHDPFRTVVSMNSKLKSEMCTGLHRAVGGDHDYPNPGDILSAALATCFESTMRMIANRLEIELIHSAVRVSAIVDVRGTLMFDRKVPVGFQYMILDVEVGSKNASDKMLKTLVNATKRSCVVYQTLKPGIEIRKSVKVIS